MLREIVLDTETTGLNAEQGHRIIEIGAVELINRRLTGNNYHVYINPEREIEKGALQVHGITNEFLLDKPTFKEIVSTFLEYLNGAQLVIHNAPFDIGFINSEIRRSKLIMGKITDYCKVVDTLEIARKKHPGQKNSLDALCKRYEIDNSHRELHGGLLDAKILAQVYLFMTGGQDSLFDHEESKQNFAINIAAEQRRNNATNIALKIVNPNNEELAAHESFMEKFKQE